MIQDCFEENIKQCISVLCQLWLTVYHYDKEPLYTYTLICKLIKYHSLLQPAYVYGSSWKINRRYNNLAAICSAPYVDDNSMCSLTLFNGVSFVRRQPGLAQIDTQLFAVPLMANKAQAGGLDSFRIKMSKEPIENIQLLW